MTGAVQRAAGRDSRDARGETVFRPGRNCWRVERADRFHCVQDGADYFRWARHALLGARRTVFLLGWDILASVDLRPPVASAAGEAEAAARQPSDAPTRLDHLLRYITRRRPQLRVYILIWDYAALYTLERDPLSRWRLGWRMPRAVRFGFDDLHPVGGSHHQKILVVDDALAFCGGIDLTGHRWDTSAHRVEEPSRVSAGEPYGPYHEIQAMVSGPAAASLGALARDRWRALGEDRLPPPGATRPSARPDLWPADATPDLTDVDVAIARTVPQSDRHPAVRECEALFLDAIAMARRSIYLESQYFTNDALGEALAARLREPDGPEVVVVVPRECSGWLEKSTMGAFRDGVFRRLVAADHRHRLRLVQPMASRSRDVPTFIHSKVMIVDDTFVRIGSANFSRRSMGVDTECDLAVDAAGRASVRAGIRRIRDRLLAEHLGMAEAAVGPGIARAGSIGALVDAGADADRTLVRVAVAGKGESPAPTEALRAAADPDAPLDVGSSVAGLVPPVDAAYGHSPLRVWILPLIVLAAAAASTSWALTRRPEFVAIQDALAGAAVLPFGIAIGTMVFVLATLALVPVELMIIASAVAFGAVRGGAVAILGSLAAAVIGYAAGRAIGPAGLSRWMTRRSHRSARQVGAHGLAGVLVLRLSSVASAGAIHLVCGATRVPVAAYLAGTALALAPEIAALSGLGALLRHTLLHPSLWNGLTTIGAALLLIGCAAALRAFLLARQFAPSVSRHRRQAEFG
jgi:phosphatidylserine/phosphatidylglycerophosphate/cardiolipin synthase-like enzyme/uncharacterized membrane protein YdjX (TVP38/TMEM64 family)